MFDNSERQSLEARVKMLQASIDTHDRIIDLWRRMPDVDDARQERELAEFTRRKEADQERIERLRELLAVAGRGGGLDG